MQKLNLTIQSAAKRYQVPFRALWIITILIPVAILIFQLMLTFPAYKWLKPYFWGENMPLELLQFVFFMFAGIQSLALTWHTQKQGEKFFIPWFYFLFALAMLFIAMEEIAWGQQFFHFNSPEFVKAFNVQNEFTLHNVEALQDRTDILNLLFGVAGVIGIAIAYWRPFRSIAIPPILSFLFGLVVIFSALGVYVDFYPVGRQFGYSIEKQTETVELFIGMAGFLYTWLNSRVLIFKLDRHVPKLAADPERIQQIPVARGYLVTILLSGIASMGWLAVIGGDQKNAWLLGLSKTRFLMLAAGIAVLLVVLSILSKSIKNPEWYGRKTTAFNAAFLKTPVLLAGLLVAIAGFISMVVLLALTVFNTDPYVAGYLNRLAPWFFWLLFIFLALCWFTLTRLNTLARLKLAHADRVDFSDNLMTVSIKGATPGAVSFLLDAYPFLKTASDSERRDFRLEKQGLRIAWPKLGAEISVQQLYSRMPGNH